MKYPADLAIDFLLVKLLRHAFVKLDSPVNAPVLGNALRCTRLGRHVGV